MSNLTALRSYLKDHELSGLVIPRTDEYQSEYLAPYAERVEWATGFTGSAGLAVITLDKAVMFVDGRYTIQVRQQTDNSVFEYEAQTNKSIADWLTDNLKSTDRIAYDPALHTRNNLELFKTSCAKVDAEFISLDSNPIDECWTDQPERPSSQVLDYPLEYSGESSSNKRQRISEQLSNLGADALVVSMPECIAWLLNVRGEDTPCVPVLLSRAIMYSNGEVLWAIDSARIDFSLQTHCGDGVQLITDEEFESTLVELAQNGSTVMVDKSTVPAKFHNLLGDNKAKLLFGNPIQNAKACKNSVELDCTKTAHIRDGVALASFFSWLETAIEETTVTELCVMDKLLAFRKEQPHFQDSSFISISGFAGNGAIVHYTSSKESNKELKKDGVFLLDSGGQYYGGTTDVTRTVVIGEPTAEQKDRFTRVLKGHISLSTCRFPEGVSGHQIDAMARRSLWDVGLDYAHGTGHGVGSYLGVHEGPQRISFGPNGVALKAGMIVSNEPGFYKEDEFGIRIENLVTIKHSQAYSGFLEFENLTMAPIDKKLIDVNLLTEHEISWVNTYHNDVYEKVSPCVVDGKVKEWLRRATESI